MNRSPLSIHGGKSLLAHKIIPLIPPHHCYCEPFMGAAWVFFKKPYESEVEILNDINGELVNLYRVIKHHLDEFLRYARWILVSREQFEKKHQKVTELVITPQTPLLSQSVPT